MYIAMVTTKVPIATPKTLRWWAKHQSKVDSYFVNTA